jgi:hypothetical protein
LSDLLSEAKEANKDSEHPASEAEGEGEEDERDGGDGDDTVREIAAECSLCKLASNSKDFEVG